MARFIIPACICLKSFIAIKNRIKTEKPWRPSWPTIGKSERLSPAVRWQYLPPTLQPQAAKIIVAQSWIALFRAFRSHQHPSAHLNQNIPQPPLGQTEQILMACTVAGALLPPNLTATWMLMLPPKCWYCLLTASGSRSDFPGVGHEGF